MSAGTSWSPVRVQDSARSLALFLAAVAVLGWVWFVVAIRGLSFSDGQLYAGGVPVALAFAIAVFGTVFSAAMTVVAWVAAVAGEAVVRIDQDAAQRLADRP
ncbi:hypothetical protein [Kineosporia sp. A_224]|uniref:hypothetical protein n=1 Tax=Kineosporia sp. A_224 TaxID=1962180 RepID=UPI00117AE737|nr:hypothetical protein [Kineosporia sp. A_224]